MFPQAQVDVTGGGLLAVVVTFLVTWLFYGVTLHLAATFFVGEVPSQLAAKASLLPVVVSLLLQQYQGSGLLVFATVAATLVADLLAIGYAYELEWRPATALTALHFAFAAVIGFALNNIFGFV